MDDRPPIAVIGMACRAAGVETLTDYWDMIDKADQRFTVVPAGRWHGLDPAATPQASLLERIDEFDAPFFRISPRMAAWMDPQQRMMLELAWHAVENAGIDPDALDGAPVATFIGSFMSDYRERMSATGHYDGAAFPGTMTAFAANRISYGFGWTGPSMVIDSACSSSLSALALAVQGLWAGEFPMALVGAPSIISHGYYASVAFRGGALSATGRSVPFSAGRDGYVRGEGGACVLLKPLPRALADGDPVHAVIHAAGVSHNARGGGLTGTDVAGQQLLMRDTATRAGLSADDLGYLEAHGSGTPAGDAVEIAALAGTVTAPAGPDGALWVGSVKANIGHLEAAAGLVGLVKTALMLQRETIVPIAGLTLPDPALPVGGSPVRVAVRHQPWRRGSRPRLAGVNSFGLGGAMAHVIVGEAPLPPAAGAFAVPSSEAGPFVVPLSGADPAAVARLAAQLLAGIEHQPGLTVASVAHTLQTARRAQRSRRVVLARDLGELRAGLRRIIGGESDPEIALSEAGPAAGSAAGSVVGPAAGSVAAFLRGGEPDWAAAWPDDSRPARVHLPGTPFQRRSYWFDRVPPPPAGPAVTYSGEHR
ncbi:putative beta-ketoacyl synthase [Actinoplanes missouriensis 431]|uniref:Putative beta-ketoacyl synthase n=1 Tax=Actinoplanes missouriensis (strain ATCC 14538 / DSM 43046 / CBS 188.64 / JCM 3121 / NBRC 102363 / NCIMB 12654 / NRRL B-3342 / UNCC 431) TaxID=512565 RepID=I0HB68_ACTM4|nr:polyketide synthase [Actinoplanes missouriensis]BAL90255.1 putative beta-ketoacyl synthase [Actinoplanes missouriensis 431]